MPTGEVEIVEFVGTVAENKNDEVTSYLLLIDGEPRKKYGNYQFEYMPKSWRDKYQVAKIEVGLVEGGWKDFYSRCEDFFDKARPFDGSDGVTEFSADKIRAGKPSTEVGRAASDTGSRSSNADRPDERSRSSSPEPDQQGESHTPPSGQLGQNSSAASKATDEESTLAMASSVRGVFEELIDKPLQSPEVLRFEISGYMALLREEAEKNPSVNLDLAQRIADSARELLNRETSGTGEHESRGYRLVQAAIRYFTVSEDATSDFREAGLKDDTAVLNEVVSELGHEDLRIE
jgi:hypothetical protein